jgi:hypothetical protein
MKKVLYIICLLSAFAACNNASNTDTQKDTPHIDSPQVIKPTASYICPMDPEVISDTAGTCPKCGMDLELKTK